MSGEPGFAGFPARAEATAIPKVFFSELLPRLADDAGAVGVALYAFKALQSQRGSPRYVTAEELCGDAGLAAYLANAGAEAEAIERGLGRAVAAGVLLGLGVEREGERRTLYFLNAPADRRGMEAVRRGDVDLGRVVAAPEAVMPRPGVFALYESIVGPLTPPVAEELTEAERLYPAEWLEAAFREAAAQNARSWRYISRILERWAIEGPDHATAEGTAAGGERYFRGKYGRILRDRLGG
ncbi:MAG: DnaD domain protein [Dehalococcoidia bacterium]